MDKPERQSNKWDFSGGRLKMLIHTSIILSFLTRVSGIAVRALASVRFFSFLSDAKRSDTMLREGILSPLYTGKGVLSARHAFKRIFATGAEYSRISGLYRRVAGLFMSASVRFYGIFFCTFGTYGAGIYLAKRYSFISQAPAESELIWAVFSLLFGLPLIFSGKSLAHSLRTSRFFGIIFIDLLGVNEMFLDDKKKSGTFGTAAFVLGSVFGISTLFIGAETVIPLFFIIPVAAGVFYAPEIGALASALLAPVMPAGVLLALVAFTSLAYAVKLLRGKRNLSVNAPDFFVILITLFAVMFAVLPAYGRADLTGAVTPVLLYFLFANLIASASLLKKSFYCLYAGSAVGFALKIFALAASGTQAGEAVSAFASVTPAGGENSALIAAVLIALAPALARRANTLAGRLTPLLIAAAGAVSIVMSGEGWYLRAAFAGVLIYSLIISRNTAGVVFFFFLSGTAAMLAASFFPYFDKLLQSDTAAFSFAFPLPAAYFLFGGIKTGGVGEVSLSAAGAALTGRSPSLYQRFLLEGGVFFLAVFLLAAFFLLQRAFAGVSAVKGRERTVPAGLAAAISVFLLTGLYGDIFTSPSVGCLFWITAGLITASYSVYTRTSLVRGEGI